MQNDRILNAANRGRSACGLLFLLNPIAMLRLYTTLLLLLSLQVTAQKKQADTVRKYLTSDLHFTNKANMEYPALAVRQSGDRWLLLSAYRDTSVLLRIWFRDEEMTIKEGPFALYHPKRVKAVEGTYVNNVRQGVWKAWYQNGKLKDSGLMFNNHLVGTWYSWNNRGELLAKLTYTHPDSIHGVITGTFNPKEKYRSVLAGDTTTGILNGPSITYFADGLTKDSGQYVNDLQEGLWKQWNKGGRLESMGTYRQGRQEGEWQYFHTNGQRSTREVYSNNKVTKLECFDEQGNPTGNACAILKPPVAQGRYLDFEKYVLDNLYWPAELKRSDIQGDVEISYTISSTGELKDLKVIRSPHEAMSREVTAFFQKLQWSPAVSHNRPVDFPMKYRVPFYR